MKLKELWHQFIDGKTEGKETEFLPAILEVTETPPSPVGRAVLWTILAFLTAAIIWACVGHINEVAVATGKVIPAGQVKTVQTKNKGIVKEIHVKDGDHVNEGDTLIVLDPTSTDADMDSLKKRAAYYKLDIDRLNAELSGAPFTPAADEDLEDTDRQAEIALYNSRQSQYRAQTASARSTIAQKTSDLHGARENYDKYQGMYEIAREKESRLKDLMQENAIAEFQLFEQTSQRIQYEKSAAAALDEINKAQAAIDALTKDGCDFVYVHVEAPDEMGHQGLLKEKIQSIEYLDRRLIAPVKKAMEDAGEDFRMLVLPDHPTPIRLRTHTGDPVPYVLYDSTRQRKSIRKYTEAEAEATGNYEPNGYRLIQQLLNK